MCPNSAHFHAEDALTIIIKAPKTMASVANQDMHLDHRLCRNCRQLYLSIIRPRAVLPSRPNPLCFISHTALQPYFK